MFRVGLTRDFADGGLLGGLMAGPVADILDPVEGVGWDYLPTYSDTVKPEEIEGFDVIVTGYPLWTAETFTNADRLTGVAYWGVGYDDIDVAAASTAHVIVSITTPAVRWPMAESIVGYMLALSKNLVIKNGLARAGREEEKTRYNGILLRNRVIGCIGVGNIGAAVIELLRPFRPARVVAFDPYLSAERAAQLGVELVDKDAVFKEADFVAVMCPLNPETRGLVGASEIGHMKESAFLINCARGAIVDQRALTDALQSGRIRGAALDVFEVEPPSPSDPLLQLDNVIVASHCIGWTDELYYENGAEDCRAALRISEGKPPEYVVNPEILDQLEVRSKLESCRERRQG
jgi:phosphoglycerate dehydrogenase-like enzyme